MVADNVDMTLYNMLSAWVLSMSEWHTIVKCCIHNPVFMQLAILPYFCLQLYHLLLAQPFMKHFM